MPCPKCGGKSLAEIVDHSCRLCEEDYKFCPSCIVSEEDSKESYGIRIARTALLGHEFDENE